MEDHNSPEAIAQIASQEDPIVMYLIVRESLNMGTGKTAAQVGHATQMLTIEYFELVDDYEHVLADKDFQASVRGKLEIMREWLNSSYRKVVLKANDKGWDRLKKEFKDTMVLVVDCGLTEIAAGSETVIGLWPMYKSNATKTIKRLQALK